MMRPAYEWRVEPDCALGFTEMQMHEQLGDRHTVFEEYMLMKARPICKGSTAMLPQGTCLVSHGMVFYAHDVIGFVEKLRIN